MCQNLLLGPSSCFPSLFPGDYPLLIMPGMWLFWSLKVNVLAFAVPMHVGCERHDSSHMFEFALQYWKDGCMSLHVISIAFRTNIYNTWLYIYISISISISIYLYFYLYVCLYLDRFLYLYLYLSLFLYLSLSVCLPVYLSLSLSISISIYLSLYQSIYLI